MMNMARFKVRSNFFANNLRVPLAIICEEIICKNFSPRFKAPDIKRISKYLGIKETDLMNAPLHRDEDGDYVLNQKPCTFLNADNTCSIYEVRPSDCHRFPYADEDVFLKRKELTMKNASFCMIAQHVLDGLKNV